MIEQMKKIIYIIAAAVLGFTACTERMDFPVQEQKLPENAKVTLEFSVPMSAQTKAEMASLPDLSASEMYVMVFNTRTGALIETPKAKEFTPATANDQKASYKVDVIMGSTPRAIHFLVDAPTHEVSSDNVDETPLGTAENPVLLGDTEAMVWQKLYTTDKEAAYWQRIELPNGIHAYTYKGGAPVYTEHVHSYTEGDDFYYDSHSNKVNEGDYINRLGDKIVDGTGFFASDDVSEKVAVVPLVRNFARIRLTSGNDALVLTKAVLANTPKAGYVAPYYSTGNQFVDNFMAITDGSLALDAAAIKASGFDAPVPENDIDTVCPAEEDCLEPDDDGVIELFTYERGIPTANPTCVLVCFNGNKWFKIDLTDTNGSYLPIYRAFDYPMEITSITGSDGYGTIGEAFSHPSIGDVSGSPETQNLTQVADGKGLNLWVEYIDYTHIGEAAVARLVYRFWHDTEGDLSANATAKITHKTSAHAVTTDELSGAAYDGTDTPDGNSGWYVVNVPLSETGDNIKRSVVRISGVYNNKTLYRDVTFAVYPTQNMTLAVTPLASDAAKQETTLTITLPNQLGFSMFPLILKIESEKDNLNPTTAETDLPVETGATLFDDSTKGNTFHFNKTINYSDYDPENGSSFDVHFKTTKASGNATTILVADQKGYFNKATIALTVQ